MSGRRVRCIRTAVLPFGASPTTSHDSTDSRRLRRCFRRGPWSSTIRIFGKLHPTVLLALQCIVDFAKTRVCSLLYPLKVCLMLNAELIFFRLHIEGKS